MPTGLGWNISSPSKVTELSSYASSAAWTLLGVRPAHENLACLPSSVVPSMAAISHR